MIGHALGFAMLCFGAGLLMNLIRLFRAPGLPDRVLALDTMTVNMIALIVLYGIRNGSGANFESAMLFAMVGFVSTIALCKFMLRGDVIE